MKAKQIALPFRARQTHARQKSNVDLIGRSYLDDYATVAVIGLCPNDDSRVMLRRDPGGRTWSMPSWLMRLIFMEKRSRRTA